MSNATMSTPQDHAAVAAARDRIVAHMNKDHQDSIRRYIQHLKGASPLSARDGRMADISLTDMTLSYGGRKPETATVPFDPPLASMREARERLIQMDQDALKALGQSDVRITDFVHPYTDAFSAANFTVCALTLAAFCRSANFEPGSLLFDQLLYRVPGFAAFCSTIQPFLFVAMVAIHAYEVTLMVAKLESHGLLMDSGIFWAWSATCFVEGFTSFKRLNSLISERTREKESKKH